MVRLITFIFYSFMTKYFMFLNVDWDFFSKYIYGINDKRDNLNFKNIPLL